MGHEWGHAFTEKVGARLTRDKEPGALSEAFSDWLGTAIEHANNCGVHTNAGVPNKMFYLLSVGGTHNGITVSPIGIQNAIRIAVKANREQWTSTSDFLRARQGMVRAAELLFGVGSPEVNQVKNAWDAVRCLIRHRHPHRAGMQGYMPSPATTKSAVKPSANQRNALFVAPLLLLLASGALAEPQAPSVFTARQAELRQYLQRKYLIDRGMFGRGTITCTGPPGIS